MATKAHQRDTIERVRCLIDGEGGQTDFIRRVWPGEDPERHKGKVHRWYHALNGIRLDELERVAKAFRKRPAFLLYGEMPEAESDTESNSGGTDIHSIMRRNAPEFVPDWLRERIGWLMANVSSDIRAKDYTTAIDASLRLLTAPLAELRRARGMKRSKPKELLGDLYQWRGLRGVEDYLLASLATARVIVHPGRAVTPEQPPEPRKSKPAKRTAKPKSSRPKRSK